MFGVVLDTKAVMLVSELAICGSLLECLKSKAWHPSLSVDVLCNFALQISNGMKYLGSQRLIHRDLAARNVLVHSLSKVKISDFGLSRSLGYGEEYYRSEFNPSMKLPIAWCAPECINFLRFTSASDVWAYGVLLWEMFTYGNTPWDGLSGSQILYKIDTQHSKLERPEACPFNIYTNLMLKCWEWNAEKRPTFENICNQLPSLMPPLLVSIKDFDCNKKDNMNKNKLNYLNYTKGEIIILLNKNIYDDGLWLGITKSGKIGLFLPENTIAFLGAQNPSNYSKEIIKSNENKCLIEKEEKKKERNKNKKNKENDNNERFKMMISEPKGDLRHTCHVGADGRNFGLLNINKNELSITSIVSPPSVRSISPVSTSSTFSLAPPRPPKNSNIHSEMTKSITNNKSINSFEEIQSPLLPPKPPRFRQNNYKDKEIVEYLIPKIIDNSSINNKNHLFLPSIFPLNEDEEKQKNEQQEYLIVSNKKEKEIKEEEEIDNEEYLRPPSICIEQINNNNNNGNVIKEEYNNNNINLFKIENEQKKLLFCFDNNEKDEENLFSLQSSFITTMEPKEFKKIEINERRNTLKKLKQIELEESINLRKNQRKSEKIENEKFGNLEKSKKEPISNFSIEAEQAYKLIVECGHNLKGHQNNNLDEIKRPLKILNPLKSLNENNCNSINNNCLSVQQQYINSNNNLENESNNYLQINDESSFSSLQHSNKLVLSPKPIPPPVPPKPTKNSTTNEIK